MDQKQIDIEFMQQALELAREAAVHGEVPVGAILVAAGKVIGRGRNQRENLQSAISHAEIHAISEGCKSLAAWRLSGCVLYVTLEPCIMCAGAISQARIERVVFGASDPKGGAVGSLYHLHEDPRLNHRFVVEAGILAEESQILLREFFQARRSGNLER